MQAESATTPLRQVYFIVQMMLMDPGNAHLTNVLLEKHIEQLLRLSPSCNTSGQIDRVVKCVEDRNYFEALKLLRQGFRTEVTVETMGHKIEEAA
jgi:flagellar biosynthesis repressor protein FlbT